MTDQTEYQTNRDLFSNHYLTDTLRDREPWNEVSDEEVREAYEEISDLVDSKIDRVEDYNEAQLERNLIRPIFDILDIPFEIEETVMRNARRPDYGFFPSDEAADAAFDREDFYEESIAVADAKRWGRKLDTRGEEKRDFENPSYQIHRYLQETPTQWAVLTNGAKWRLYYEPTSHRLDSYYEIDLPTLIDVVTEEDDIESFKYFYLFFRQKAFLPDQNGDCFLDDVYNESNVFAEELGEDLQENIYEAIRVLAEGFIETNEELNEADLDLIHDSSLIYLYRLIFVLYAESEGRNLLPTNNDIYSSSYSLNQLKQTVVEKRSETQQHYQTWQTDLWDRLNELFILIDQGSQGHNIPKEDLYIPAYNGGLFRTDPDPSDSDEAQFLASNEVGDEYIAEVIELLTRHEASEGEGEVFVDYSSLDERSLGSIYEGLLEYKLDVANNPLALEEGEYTPAEEDEDVAVQAGEVYLRTDDGERKATGSYYTPEYVVEYIVDETLGPIVDNIREDMLAESARGDEQKFAEKFADRVFDLTVLDPAMGSGHFLVNAVDYLAREIIDAQEQQDRQAIESEQDEVRSPTTEEGELRDINWARRKIAQKCIYGVDVNGLATELSKVSLWLRTLAAEQPLAFLDHHLKTGNSLVGSDITAVLSEDNENNADGQLTLTQSFARARQETLGHVMNLMQDLLAIDNDKLADIKSMEELYDEIRDDPLYQRLFEIANVHTAEQFGLDLPEGVYEEMAGAIDDGDEWNKIRSQDWFVSAQATADEQSFLHWELEYPEVFFGEDGGKRDDAGFDAVVGNPPYVRQEQISELKPYLTSQYIGYHSAADLYVYFLEKGHRLAKHGGMLSYIVSNKFMMSSYGKNIREYLNENSKIRQLIDFHDLPVFSRDISTYPLIFALQREKPKENTKINVTKVDTLSFNQLSSYIEHNMYTVSQSSLRGNLWNLANKKSQDILDKMNESSSTLTEYVGSPLYRGVLTGLNEAFVINNETKEKLVNANQNNKKFIYPLLKGDDISRYHIEFQDRFLIRIPSGWSKKQAGSESESEAWEWFCKNHPAISSHLEPFENKAKERYDRGDCWWELRPCDYYDLFEEEKVIYPDISDGSTFAFDNKGYHMVNTCYFFPTNSKSIVAVLNSKLITWYYEFVTSEYRGGYNRSFTNAIEDFPIPEQDLNSAADIEIDINGIDPDNSTTKEQLLEIIGSEIIEKIYKLNGLNRRLLDHLGNYSPGQSLADIGLTQPPTGAAGSILQETSEAYPNLRVGTASVIRKSPTTVEIQLTARYKPDNEDKHETDQWGYTETEFLPALKITDLSETEADLISAFVPVAVDEAGGFAGFRDSVTKTNSLIDRLQKLTLPRIADVETGLEQYNETKQRAEELENKIQRTDDLIDEIVYELYGLSDEEIEIVEEAVEDD